MSIDSRFAAAAQRGPVRRSERSLAPDLARGVMLLFIAFANAVGVVFGGQPGAEPDPHGIERLTNLLLFVFVHCRSYPVFAVMYGYGLVQLAARQEAAGAAPGTVRSLLLRRGMWLVVIGFLHAALLYFGDFLGAYGIVGMVATVLLLPRGDRVHRLALWVWAASAVEMCVLGVLVALRVAHGCSGSAGLPFSVVPSLVAQRYAASMFARLAEWPVHTATVAPFIMIVWLGMWGARHRLLEDAAGHSRLLRGVAVFGFGVAVAGGLPLGLVGAGMLRVDSETVARMWLLNQGSGMFAGPGYVALFGLAATGISRSRSSSVPIRVTSLISALGQRSLSAYLFQSLAWLLLLSPYTLALGHRFGSPLLTAVCVALGIWLASLVGAWVLDKRSDRGPAENVLRCLTYARNRI